MATDVFFNPANIVGQNNNFDISLISASSFIGNNSASFKLRNIGHTFHPDSVAHEFFGTGSGLSNGIISVDVHGPSVMFAAGKKTSVAITTRARLMGNVIDFDGQFVNDIYENYGSRKQMPYTIAGNNSMRVNLNAWTEYGVSVASVIKDAGKHFLKGGITLKLLAGAGNAYLHLAKINATLNEDDHTQDYLTKTTGGLIMGFSGMNTNNVKAIELLKPKSFGLGLDYGFIYEFRPGYQKESNKSYKLKIGIAVLDVGSIKYSKDKERSGAYKFNITGNKRFYLKELKGVKFDDYNKFFKSKKAILVPDSTQNKTSVIRVATPGTFQAQLDYNIHKSFYLNISSIISLSNSDSVYNSHYYGSITVTPRFESRAASIYLPVSYNKYTKLSAGLGARVGPLYFGSGSLFSTIFSSAREADVYAGISINSGMLGSSSKSKRLVVSSR